MIQYENEGFPIVGRDKIAIKDYVTVTDGLIQDLDALEIKDTIYYIEQDCIGAYTEAEEPQPIKSDKLWFVSDLDKTTLKGYVKEFYKIFQKHSNQLTKALNLPIIVDGDKG
jgi:hypothetical protein